MFVLPSLGVWLKSALEGTLPTLPLALLSAASLGIGFFVARLRWARLPTRVAAWVPALAIAHLTLVSHLSVAHAAAVPVWEFVFWYFAGWIWIGLAQARWTAARLAPLGVAGFLLSSFHEMGWASALFAGLMVTCAGTALAELIAWNVTGRREAYERIQQQASIYRSIVTTTRRAARASLQDVYETFADVAVEIGCRNAGVARMVRGEHRYDWRALRGENVWAAEEHAVAQSISAALRNDDLVEVRPHQGSLLPKHVVIPIASNTEVGHALVVVPPEGHRPLKDETRQALILLATEAGNRLAVLRLAYYDQLTGLPNRALFEQHMADAFVRAAGDTSYRFAVIFIDIDRFKFVNDAHGHRVGDAVLEHTADRLRSNLRTLDVIARLESSTPARVGGDEFAVLLSGIHSEDETLKVAKRLVDTLRHPNLIGGREIRTGASAGVVLSNPRYESASELLRDADIAMYRSKRSGEGGVALFDQTMHRAVVRRLHLEEDLRRALAREDLELVYQPIIRANDGSVAGFEALARWNHPQEGPIDPEEFIDVAEDLGVVVEFGEWAIRRAAQQLADWSLLWRQQPPLYLTVNVSRRHLRDPHLLPRIRDWVRHNRLDRDQIRLEVTETVVMEDLDTCRRTLQALHDWGVKLALDDFGTGYSSLACLHQLPVDAVKLDREFVDELPKDERRQALVRAITGLSHELGMHVIAEGVETREQQELLVEAGCDKLQGFLLSRPLAADAVVPWLEARSDPGED